MSRPDQPYKKRIKEPYESMKRTTISLVLVGLALSLSPLPSHAQATPNPPGQISYQGFLTDANGLPLATNAPINYNVIFRIFNASISGTLLWAEQQVVTVDRGYFTVMLGNGSAVSGAPNTNNLSTVFFGSDASDRYLEMTVQGLAQGDPPIAPRLRLLASPYSFLAGKALNVDGAALATGTIADARLSSNVALRAGGNNFTGVQTVTSGSVAIGKTSPTTALDVNGTVTAIAFSGSGAGLTGVAPANGSASYIQNQTSSDQAAGLRISGNAFFNGGQVGIGTTAPTDTLQVNGTIQGVGFRCKPGIFGQADLGHDFNFDWINNSQLHAYIDNLDVGIVASISDRRLKEDIQPLANGALDRVMALQPSMFKYKEILGSIFHGDGQVNEGFIAEELQQVIPSAVNGDKDALTKDGQIQPQTLNIIPVVSVLTKAMQEQQQTIQQQQRAMQEEERAIQGLNQKLAQRLEQKETEITELKARLEKLEELLEHNSNGTAR
jgi:hypothetical protein